MLITRVVVSVLWVGLIFLCTGTTFGQPTSTSSGQAYPNKTIRILTNETGGGNDIALRLITPGLTSSMGQPVIVENRPALISVESVAKASPDGYTLLLVGSSMWLLPYMRSDVPWDPTRDFAPITMAMEAPTVMVVNPALPVKSVKDLIALAKAKPGELNYSAGARGGAQHLSAELFNLMAGVKIVGVAYKGGGPSLTALMGGEVQVSFPTGNTLTPQLKSGKLRAVAVTSAQPSALFPGLPTVAATGLPGYESVVLTAMFVPAKTPAPLVRRLNQEIVRVLRQPEVKEKFFNAGVEVVANSPEQTAAMIKAEMTRMGKVIKEVGIKAD